MAMEPIPAARLRQLRDAVLRYVYKHGAGKWGWGVPIEQVEKAFTMSKEEFQAVTMLLMEQGLSSKHGTISDIGLSPAGQEEGVRLGSDVPMHDPRTGPIVIHANYSVVQLAGSGSTQSAQLTVNRFPPLRAAFLNHFTSPSLM